MNVIGRQYNALTGAELRSVILKEVGQALDNAGINSAAETYPLASWSWSMTLLQKDDAGHLADTPERTITAGESLEEIEKAAAENPASKLLNAIRGGSRRFSTNPPSPTEVRKSEDLPVPEM